MFYFGFKESFQKTYSTTTGKNPVRPSPTTTEAVPQAQPELRVRVCVQEKTELPLQNRAGMALQKGTAVFQKMLAM